MNLVHLPTFNPVPFPFATLTGKRRPWTPEDRELLGALYPSEVAIGKVAARLDRSVIAVYSKARRLKLRRPSRGGADQPQLPLLFPGQPAASAPPARPPARPAARPAASPVSKVLTPKPFRRTVLGGRETTWNAELVARLVRLWVANFHHETIAEVLGVTPKAASSKACRISLPARAGLSLSRDVGAARAVDEEAGPMPKQLNAGYGRKVIGKHCSLTGNWFYAPPGIHTSQEAKNSLHYQRMSQAF